MKTRLLIMFTIGIIGLTGLSFPIIFACECGESTVEQRIENSDVIFSGKLYPNVWDFSEHKIAGNFNVIQVWKGADSFPQITTGDVTVVTGVDSGICGVEFVPNNKYLIFAKIDGDVLATSSCSGSWFLDGRADDVQALNAMKAEPEEPEPPTISDEQDKMLREYCETGIRHPDMIGIPQCIKNEIVCGPGSELVDGICHVIKYEKSDHMTPSIFLDGFFFMIFVSPFFIPSAIIFIVLSKTPRYDKKIRLVICIPAIIVILYFLWGLLVGWYPPGYA